MRVLTALGSTALASTALARVARSPLRPDAMAESGEVTGAAALPFSPPIPDRQPGEPQGMRLSSPAFADGEAIPRLYTAEGSNLSPPLCWSGVPAEAGSLCLVLDDPDAPAGVWLHWLLYDIPPDATGLPAGVPPLPRLPDGALQGRCWGVRSFERLGYQGPQPPPGPPHRYRFTLTALRGRSGLAPGATAPKLRAVIAAQRLAEAVLIGTYAAAGDPLATDPAAARH